MKDLAKEQRRIACAEELGWDYDENGVWNPQGQRHERNRNPMADEPDGVSLLPDPESSLNDCKPLIEMANNFQLFKLLKVYEAVFVTDSGSYYGEASTPESAIVEAFLKWRGRT